MSHHEPKPEPVEKEPQVIGVLGEFAGPDELVAGARAIREKGYRKVEAFSPFPIHGIDEALAAPKPILPWVVFGAGSTGCIVAILMQWYMNAFEAPIPFSGYDYGISGKPSWSLPANIPVTFELIVLFSAFTAFLGMIAFNQLPRLSNPLFRNERFTKATDNRFFLLVEANDPQFATESITTAFESIGATHVESVLDEPSSSMPAWIMPVGTVLAVIALIPLGLVVMNRNKISDTPRLSIWWDMDYQPKYKAQTVSTLFPDQRAARMPVAGTVARGHGDIDPALDWGYIPEGDLTFETALLQEEGDGEEEAEESADGDSEETEESSDSTEESEESSDGESSSEESTEDDSAEEESGDEETEETEDSADSDESSDATEESSDESSEESSEQTDKPDGEGDSSEEGASDEAAETKDAYQWVTEFPEPLRVSSEMMDRGQKKYNIYCAVCHGYAGDGDGLVHQRAIELNQLATWAPPTSLHTEKLTKYPVGKLYDTVANGNISGWTDQGTPIRGRMAGYKQQLSVEDRWAVVLYIKALQKTRLVSPDDLTPEELAKVK